jgi:hypothetical protein
MTLSEIIQTDDLHWNRTEKRFVSLSEEELDKIVMACVTCGIEDDDLIIKMVRWAEEIRTGNLLLKGVLEDRLGILFKEENEPSFFALDNSEEI